MQHYFLFFMRCAAPHAIHLSITLKSFHRRCSGREPSQESDILRRR
ncbi:MAG: hypothetical protein ACTS81_04870 [Arsenophonus sp. ER-BJ3-MAG3]